jgi:hypothetical protein
MAAELVALRSENSVLLAQIDTLRAKIGEQRVLINTLRAGGTAFSASHYPLTDKYGRRYRLEGNIKCFAPS